MAVIQNIEKIISNVTGERPLCCKKWQDKIHVLLVKAPLLLITLRALKRYYNRLILSEIVVVNSWDLTELFPEVPHPSWDKPDQFVLMYHLLSIESGGRFFLYIEITADEGVESAMEIWPGAWIQEMEAWRLFGIVFRGGRHFSLSNLHGQFKGYPLRKSYLLTDYQEYQKIASSRIDSAHKEFERKKVTLINPIHSSCKIEGEVHRGKVVNPILEWGYLHKGFEKIAESTKYRHLTRLLERIGFRTPVISSMVYLELMERALGIAIPIRASAIRVIFRETGRILSHLQRNLDLLSDLNLFIYANQTKNYIVELSHLHEKVTGSRLSFDMMQLGGVRSNLEINDCNNLKLMLGHMQKELAHLQNRLENDVFFLHSTRDIAVVTQEDCVNYGLTGILARSAGLSIDSRKENAGYIELGIDFDIPVREAGDVYSRFCLSTYEILESIGIVLKLLGKLPYGEVRNRDLDIEYSLGPENRSNIAHMFSHCDKVLSGVQLPSGQYFNFGESGGGEQALFLVGQNTAYPYRLKYRSPSMANAACFEYVLEGMDLEVVDMAFKSFFIEPWEMDR
jgi:NADH:ubiquinone oxidoreductase subunit D/NADH:ubiquinone oxidoreductase subunit C